MQRLTVFESTKPADLETNPNMHMLHTVDLSPNEEHTLGTETEKILNRNSDICKLGSHVHAIQWDGRPSTVMLCNKTVCPCYAKPPRMGAGRGVADYVEVEVSKVGEARRIQGKPFVHRGDGRVITDNGITEHLGWNVVLCPVDSSYPEKLKFDQPMRFYTSYDAAYDPEGPPRPSVDIDATTCGDGCAYCATTRVRQLELQKQARMAAERE
jgi:hypothetical protein